MLGEVAAAVRPILEGRGFAVVLQDTGDPPEAPGGGAYSAVAVIANGEADLDQLNSLRETGVGSRYVAIVQEGDAATEAGARALGASTCVWDQANSEAVSRAIAGAVEGDAATVALEEDLHNVRRNLEREISQRKFMEEALQTSLRRLELAYDQVKLNADELRNEIAQRKRAEEALASSEELRRLQAVQTAREDERKRLAEELHDVTMAEMAGAAMEVGFLARQVEAEASNNLDTALLDLRGRLRDTEQGLRHIVRGIYPSVLTNLGLVPAVRNHIEDLSGRPLENPTPIQVIVRASGFGNERLPEENEIGLYRFVQQALTNAIAHAQASEIVVELAWRDSELSISVSDNGVGFDVDNPKETPQSGHFGLVNMRDRIEGIEGNVEIISAPGEGTAIQATLPTFARESSPSDVQESRIVLGVEVQAGTG